MCQGWYWARAREGYMPTRNFLPLVTNGSGFFAILLYLWWYFKGIGIPFMAILWHFNSLVPGKFEWNYRYIIFKRILVIDVSGISSEISLIWMSLDSTDDQSTVVPVMDWCRQATSHWANVDPDLFHRMASLGHNGLRCTGYRFPGYAQWWKIMLDAWYPEIFRSQIKTKIFNQIGWAVWPMFIIRMW